MEKYTMKIAVIAFVAVIMSGALISLVYAKTVECERLFYQGFDACNMDYLSDDPHFYTQVQKNNWDRTMELRELETFPRIVITDFQDKELAIGNEGLWLNNEIVFHYPNNLTSQSTVGATDYYVNGKIVRNFYGYDETNPMINFTTVPHSCIEFGNGEKTGIDVLNYYGIYTIGCEDWMVYEAWK